MASSINASITSTGIVQSADASGILQLQSDGTTGLTLNANANVTINNSLFVSGNSVQPLVSGTAQATTSGTTVNFSSIPSWVKRLTIVFSGISSSGTSNWQIQLGTGSTSYTTSGYNGTTTTGAGTSAAMSTGFLLSGAVAATNIFQGTATIVNLSGNIWSMQSMIGFSDSAATRFSAGSITLASPLTAVRLTTVNGTDTFDAGSVNILYE